jgi:hypothetical protein
VYHKHAGTSEALLAKLLMGQTLASTAARRRKHYTAAMIAPSSNCGSALQPYAAASSDERNRPTVLSTPTTTTNLKHDLTQGSEQKTRGFRRFSQQK